MPEIGGKKFASDFRGLIETELAKAFEEGRQIIGEATQELRETIRNQAKGAARVLRKEAQHIRDGMGDYTGNNPPETEENPTTEKQEGGE